MTPTSSTSAPSLASPAESAACSIGPDRRVSRPTTKRLGRLPDAWPKRPRTLAAALPSAKTAPGASSSLAKPLTPSVPNRSELALGTGPPLGPGPRPRWCWPGSKDGTSRHCTGPGTSGAQGFTETLPVQVGTGPVPPTGTISSQVVPGVRVILAPSSSTNTAGSASRGRTQRPTYWRPSRKTHAVPLPFKLSTYSWVPVSSSTQGVSSLSTSMTITLENAICAPSPCSAGPVSEYERYHNPVLGRQAQVVTSRGDRMLTSDAGVPPGGGGPYVNIGLGGCSG